MVRALHEAGIEVILDVVYNHTAEGNHLGPTLSLPRHRQRRPTTGWSTTTRRTTTTPPAPATRLLMRHPHVLQLIMDSLRYWVIEMHVDGFRFDLAVDAGPPVPRGRPAVARSSTSSSRTRWSRQVKLIAEPWDVGEGGYQVGNFPPLWTEWNGKYRDTVRDFWRGEPRDAGGVRLPADRLDRPLPGRRPAPARLDQLRHRPRRLHPARPGLVQRQAQRGQRRGQPRRREPQPVVELRRRGRDRRPRGRSRCASGRSATSSPRCSCPRACRCCCTATSSAAPRAATTTPTARTTRSPGSTGSDARENWALTEFTERAGRAAPRAPGVPAAPVLPGRPDRGSESELGDIAWFTPAGEQMSEGDWQRRLRQVASPSSSTATRIAEPDARGERITDDSFLLLFNGHHEDMDFTLPDARRTASAGRSCSTPPPRLVADRPTAKAGEPVTVESRSILVLRRVV